MEPKSVTGPSAGSPLPSLRLEASGAEAVTSDLFQMPALDVLQSESRELWGRAVSQLSDLPTQALIECAHPQTVGSKGGIYGIKGLLFNVQGAICGLSDRSLLHYDRETKKIQSVEVFQGEPLLIEGQVYWLSRRGIFRYDPLQNQGEQILSEQILATQPFDLLGHYILAVSEDKKRMALTGDTSHELVIIDLSQINDPRLIKCKTRQASDGYCTGIAFAGDRIAFSYKSDNGNSHLQLYNLEGQQISSLVAVEESRVQAIAADPN